MWESLETAVKKRFASMSCDNVRKFVTEEDLRRFLGHLISYLYRRTKGHTPAEMAAELHTLQAMGPFYQTLQHFEGSSYVQINVPQNDALKHLQPESARMMEDHVTTTISTNKSLPNRNGTADKQPVLSQRKNQHEPEAVGNHFQMEKRNKRVLTPRMKNILYALCQADYLSLPQLEGLFWRASRGGKEGTL